MLRIKTMPELTDRDKSILNAIIREYVETGEPVGSRIIARKYLYTLSPATVRNVMSDLEEMGLLYQPHVSAGRIPTPEGFRCYLNDIMEVKSLPRMEKTMISRQMSHDTGDIRETLRKASILLSKISERLDHHSAQVRYVLLQADRFYQARREQGNGCAGKPGRHGLQPHRPW